MVFLVYLIFIFSLLGGFGRLHIFGYPVYFYEPLLFVFSLLSILKETEKKRKVIFSYFLPGFIFVFWIGLITILKGNKAYLLLGLGYVFRLFLYILAFYSFTLFLFKNKEKKNIFIKRINFFYLFFIFVLLIQYIFFPDLTVMKYIGWDPHYKRLVGSFLDPYLSASLLGLLSFFAYRRREYFLSFVFFVLLVLTNSRAGIFSFIVAFFITSRKKIGGSALILLPVLIIVLFSLNSGIAGRITRVETIESRVFDYKQGFKFFIYSPIIGNGYASLIQFREENKKPFKHSMGEYNPKGSFHSSYLTILGIGGLVGFVFFIMFIKKLVELFPFKEFYLFIGIFSFFDNVLLHPLVLLYISFIFPFLSISTND